MGGCRCSYKNCTQRTDGSTHMFHYPVFDKVRCHQWLTNAQKLEFLNLKVSQLKNRVVCQHHFKKDNFMNFRNDKLTFDAVPTEDGPFCDSSQFNAKEASQDDSTLYSISLEDIENEYLTFNDKKANFSVKYGDFLTNCDLMDLESMNLTDNTQLRLKGKHLEEPNEIVLNSNRNRKRIVDQKLLNYNTLDAVNSKNNVFTIHVSEVPLEIEGTNSSLTIPNINICHVPSTQQVAEKGNNIICKTHKSKDQHTQANKDKSLKENRKIIIIDEQKISEPMPVSFPVKLEPVCPSTVLPLPNKKKKINLHQEDTVNKKHSNDSNKVVAPNVIANDITFQSIIIEQETNNVIHANSPSRQYNTRNKVHAHNKDNDIIAKVVKTQKNILSNDTNKEKIVSNNLNRVKPVSHIINKEKSVSNINREKAISNKINVVNVKKNNNSLLKNKMPPERMAAIEEKRKFNMKLRDIIASCLDKLDDEESKDSTKSPSKIDRNTSQKVHTYLSKQADLPDYSVAYLEARMKRMENLLINKIDQNTQKISEMQQLLVPKPDKKAAHTQTTLNEESQKKHLYQEISKYLSPEANSLLFEELFINKYVKTIPKCSPTKKRKLR